MKKIEMAHALRECALTGRTAYHVDGEAFDFALDAKHEATNKTYDEISNTKWRTFYLILAHALEEA